MALSIFRRETVASVLASNWKGDTMFWIGLKDAYFQIPIHAEMRPYLWFIVKKIHQFKSFILWLFFSTPYLHKSVCSNPEVGPPEWHSTTSISGCLASHHRFSTISTKALLPPFPVVSVPGDYHQHGKVGPWVNSKDSVLRNAGGHHPREGRPIGLLAHQVLKCRNQIPFTSQTFVKAVTPVPWTHNLSGAAYLAQMTQDVSPPVAFRSPLILCGGPSQYLETAGVSSGGFRIKSWQWESYFNDHCHLSSIQMHLRLAWEHILGRWSHPGSGRSWIGQAYRHSGNESSLEHSCHFSGQGNWSGHRPDVNNSSVLAYVNKQGYFIEVSVSADTWNLAWAKPQAVSLSMRYISGRQNVEVDRLLSWWSSDSNQVIASS